MKPSKSNPVLVLLDGHHSHKSLEAVELARKHSVTMVTIPPHTSHRLQPLDLTFFGPLKHAYNCEVDKWMVHNPGKRVTDYDLCEIFTPAYNRVANIDKAVNGFKCSGIVPFNPDIFAEEDFAPSSVTERPCPHPVGTENEETDNLDVEPVTPVSSKQSSGNSHVDADPKASTSTHVSVLDISPYPRAAASTSGSRKRKAEVSTVLTSTPNKTLLLQKRKEMEMSKTRKKIRFEQREGKGKPQEISRPKMKKANGDVAKEAMKNKQKQRTNKTKTTSSGAKVMSTRSMAKTSSSTRDAVVSPATYLKSSCLSNRRHHKLSEKQKGNKSATNARTGGVKVPRPTSSHHPEPRQPVWIQQYRASGVFLFFHFHVIS